MWVSGIANEFQSTKEEFKHEQLAIILAVSSDFNPPKRNLNGCSVYSKCIHPSYFNPPKRNLNYTPQPSPSFSACISIHQRGI